MSKENPKEKFDIGLKYDCVDENAPDDYLLTAKQYNAIELLLSGEDKSSVARSVGVSRQTLYRWLKDDRFVAELTDCTTEKKRQTINYINSKALIAAKKYWALTDCGDNRTKMGVLKDWLNRAIGAPASNVEITETKDSSDDFDLDKALKQIQADMKKD